MRVPYCSTFVRYSSRRSWKFLIHLILWRALFHMAPGSYAAWRRGTAVPRDISDRLSHQMRCDDARCLAARVGRKQWWQELNV